MKLEMHVHTKYSKDSMLCFFPLYIKCRIKSINAIAITEHNNIEGAIKFQEFCRKMGNKINVIIGEEIFTDSGEVIGLFLSENIAPQMTVEETICEIKRQNGVVCIPHPYDKKREKTVLKEEAIKRVRKQIDCMEVHNGRNISKTYDIEQREIANKYNIKPIVGSDAHTLIEIGRNYMSFEGEIPLSREQFLKSLDTFEPVANECILIAHKITAIVKIIKLIKEGQFHEVRYRFNERIKRGK